MFNISLKTQKKGVWNGRLVYSIGRYARRADFLLPSAQWCCCRSQWMATVDFFLQILLHITTERRQLWQGWVYEEPLLTTWHLPEALKVWNHDSPSPNDRQFEYCDYGIAWKESSYSDKLPPPPKKKGGPPPQTSFHSKTFHWISPWGPVS